MAKKKNNAHFKDATQPRENFWKLKKKTILISPYFDGPYKVQFSQRSKKTFSFLEK